MVISGNMPPWVGNPFNAGVFGVRRDSVGRELVNFWMSKYPAEKWHKGESMLQGKRKGNWRCDGDLCHMFSGPVYEQGAFEMYVWPWYKGYINQVEWSVINNPYCEL